MDRLGAKWGWAIALALLAAAGVYHIASTCIGWNGPITDAHSFRQTQTAISAYWLVGHPFQVLSYETPVLGPPWPIPFEFPIYQSCVAAIVTWFHTPLDQTGRFVNVLFFWLTLAPLYCLLGRLGVSRALRLVVMALVLLNPFYLFWSRCVMIESTALFFSMAFLAAAAGYAAAPRWWMLASCVAWGTLAGLAKITTFVPFAGGAALVVLYFLAIQKPGRAVWLARAAATAAMLAVPLGMAALWTHHADAVKSQNALGTLLTSKALTTWNFGTLADRCSARRWYYGVLHPLLHMQYHTLVLLGCAVALALARRRLAVIGGCLLLYLAGPMIFTGVYGHTYYGFANLIFVLVAMGLSIVGLLECGGWRKLAGVVLLAGAMVAAVYQHQTLYLPLQRRADPFIPRLADVIRRTTKPDDVIVIYGRDWWPDIAYFAQRRALMLATFGTREAGEKSAAAPWTTCGSAPWSSSTLGSAPVGARPPMRSTSPNASDGTSVPCPAIATTLARSIPPPATKRRIAIIGRPQPACEKANSTRLSIGSIGPSRNSPTIRPFTSAGHNATGCEKKRSARATTPCTPRNCARRSGQLGEPGKTAVERRAATRHRCSRRPATPQRRLGKHRASDRGHAAGSGLLQFAQPDCFRAGRNSEAKADSDLANQLSARPARMLDTIAPG